MNKKLLTIALVLFSFTTGCTTTYVAKLAPQSHFDYPNSNVYPLGHVKGEASRTSILVPPERDSGLEVEAISKALEQIPGADMLVNTFHLVDITVIPIPILSPTTITYRVEGTAAQMKAGTQALK